MKTLSLTLLALTFYASVFCQPTPGDVFREYIWLPEMVQTERGKFLRVGGRLDYKTNFDHFPEHRQYKGYILFGKHIELKNAIKAEIQIEKVGSHEDTKSLRVSINQNPSIIFPPSRGIPEPEADYMHHNYPIVPVSLNELNEGIDNSFRLDVDSVQKWNWPQNIIYGLILRVYYNPDSIRNKTEIKRFSKIRILSESQSLELADPNGSIREVQYVGYYDDVNHEGDGIYRQWHYHYFRGQVIHHIGTSYLYPFSISWNTSWLPDQEDIKVAARVVSNTGLIYFTAPLEGLKLDRTWSVELCKPYDQPKNWVTRQDDFESKVDLQGNPDCIDEVRLYWTSWSPCYANGVYINNVKVFEKEGPCYEYMAHEVILSDFSMIKQGTNVIKTGKEPLHDGKMVHGMEVQWPGIMMKVKFAGE